MSKTGRRLVLLLVSVSLAACAPSQPEKVRFSGSVPTRSDRDYANWPVEPLKAALLMQEAEIKALSVESAGAGMTRPEKAEILFPQTGDKFSVKGKLVPPDLDGINNSPRKELAAWQLQTIFLDPVDFTVPSTVLRCVPIEKWMRHHDEAIPVVPDTKCVLVEVTVWIENATVPDELYEEERFLDDLDYAYHLANFNIFAYLINLRDNRKGNVLVSKDEENRRVFAVDNGVSFGTIWYNWIYPPTYSWRTISVPALPRKSIDRLRELRREDLDFLMVVAQLEPDADGILKVVQAGAPIDPSEGVRREGTTLQFGLTAGEVEDVWQRIEALIERVDAGEIPLF
ncbi:MAG: hypothetical protein JRE43_06980 [Deltaproteobacteria bacterium]|jgi:hypothetical protein|nr:hypothetical protein [Deltaproteobacteria bacterium]